MYLYLQVHVRTTQCLQKMGHWSTVRVSKKSIDIYTIGATPKLNSLFIVEPPSYK